jgi:DNA-binding response OmpR family regulator
MLTARDGVGDTVAGGAHDYMPKPFRFEELLVRGECAAEETVLTVADTAFSRGRVPRRKRERTPWRGRSAPCSVESCRCIGTMSAGVSG